MEILCSTFNNVYNVLESHRNLINGLHFVSGSNLSDSIVSARRSLQQFDVEEELTMEMASEGKGVSCSYYLQSEEDDDSDLSPSSTCSEGAKSSGIAVDDEMRTQVAMNLDMYREITSEYEKELAKLVRRISSDADEIGLSNDSEWCQAVARAALTENIDSQEGARTAREMEEEMKEEVWRFRRARPGTAALALSHVVRLIRLLRCHRSVLQKELISVRTQKWRIEDVMTAEEGKGLKKKLFIRKTKKRERKKAVEERLQLLRRLEKTDEILTSMEKETDQQLLCTYNAIYEHIQLLKRLGKGSSFDLSLLGIKESTPTRLELLEEEQPITDRVTFKSQPLRPVKIIVHSPDIQPIPLQPPSCTR